MSFLVYYGHDETLIPRLRQCQVLIYEPRGWTSQQLTALRAKGGPKLLGYLSPLAWPAWAGPSKWWWGPSQPDPEWNARWHSLAWPGWRRQVNQLLLTVRQSSHGVFLDNLDRLELDPRSLPHLTHLLAGLKREWPESYLLGNRGFAHWPQLSPLLDGVLVETMTDQSFTSSDRQWVERQIERIQSTSVDLYALDYASRCDTAESDRLRGLFPDVRYYRAPDQSLQSLA